MKVLEVFNFLLSAHFLLLGLWSKNRKIRIEISIEAINLLNHFNWMWSGIPGHAQNNAN